MQVSPIFSRNVFFPFVLVILVGGCGRSILAPVGQDPRVTDISESEVIDATNHLVKNGDTLYSIAFKYGLNYREIANWNNIPAPYVIYPGQRLVLAPGAEPTLTSNSSEDINQTTSSTGLENTTQSDPPPDTQAAVADKQIAAWVWPVKGRVTTSYKHSGRKGIDISGDLGQSVRAAADGKVVYSGGGLIGYGELIIIKHNKKFLSAYGHNNKLLVKQGDFVRSGQRIATMGHSGTDEVKLHFEIRRDGKPVDPIRYLPK